MRLTLALALLSSQPAWADGDTLSRLEGVYGSVGDAELSCATNAHRLSFASNPPHAFLEWQEDWVMDGGLLSNRAVYDLVGEAGDALILRLEGEHRRTDSGQRVIWIMRPNADYSGYCWGRTDWPLVRCVDPQIRCEVEAPTS